MAARNPPTTCRSGSSLPPDRCRRLPAPIRGRPSSSPFGVLLGARCHAVGGTPAPRAVPRTGREGGSLRRRYFCQDETRGAQSTDGAPVLTKLFQRQVRSDWTTALSRSICLHVLSLKATLASFPALTVVADACRGTRRWRAATGANPSKRITSGHPASALPAPRSQRSGRASWGGSSTTPARRARPFRSTPPAWLAAISAGRCPSRP